MIFVAPAVAAPPANDDFANAQSIALPSTTSGTLAESTIQSPDEPNHAGPSVFIFPTQSVWYQWTSPGAESKVKLSVCPEEMTGIAPGVAVYTGSALSSLALVATSGPNSLGPTDCSVKLTAPPSTTYKIAVFNKSSSSHTVTLGDFQLELRTLNPPANDDFVNAVTIPSSLPQTVDGTNVDATAEPGESGRSSVWYSWTPSVDRDVRLDSCGDLNTGLPEASVAVYTGTQVDSLATVAHFQGCKAYFDALAGQTYRIAIDLNFGNASEAPFSLMLRQGAPPPNDDLADAEVIGGPIQDIAGTTFDATKESGEPGHVPGAPGSGIAGPPGSVWFEWTSGSMGGTVSIDACHGLFAHSVAVYTGDTYADPLVDAAANDASCLQQFTAAPSTTYKIAVQGYGGGGAFVLNPTTPPVGTPALGGGSIPGPGPDTAPGPTGQRAAALKKCKKKHGRAHNSCVKHAKRLPI